MCKSVTIINRKLRDQYGNETGDELVQTTTTEANSLPNIQALSTWLYHHSPEWREQQMSLKAAKAEEKLDEIREICLNIHYTDENHLGIKRDE